MRIFLLAFSLLFFSCSAMAEEVVVPEEYKTWLNDLKKEMLDKGISQDTIDKAYPEKVYHYKPEVVRLDAKQPEFVMTTTDYLNRIVTKKRVENAREKYKKLHPLFKDMETKYGVPINYLIAFWAAETNFGTSFGHFKIIPSLTTLSYKNRRSEFFKKELYEALKIVDIYGIDPDDMEGSWAGAMGNFQFMPSTFNSYAVDYDGDGKIDIWHSFEDSIASAANYLSSLGWKKDEPWGMEVSLGDKFNYEYAGFKNVKTIKDWKSKSVKDSKGKEIKLADGIKGSIILPEGRRGKAYLVLDNFRKIMIWNCSDRYALAVSKLADYTVSKEAWKAEVKNPAVVLKTDDVWAIQKFLNSIGIQTAEDGQFGSGTKEAVKELQKKAMIPQDGYPDYHLLEKINNYNPEVGFVVPIQPKKVVRKKK